MSADSVHIFNKERIFYKTQGRAKGVISQESFRWPATLSINEKNHDIKKDGLEKSYNAIRTPGGFHKI